MKFIGFTHDLQYPTGDHNAYVSLRFPGARTPTVIRAMLDTGAAVSVINRQFARHLNVSNITDTTDTMTLTLADGRPVLAYVHRLPAEFLGRPLMIDVAFVPTIDTADLIGMRGFFDQMIVAFDHSRRTVHVAFN
jgi:hypothetical protein